MGQIALEGMEFFAFHGYYDEEQKIGNKYGVDLYISTDLHAAGTSDKLQETVNYEVLYRVVAEEMRAPARLLEHVGHRVLDRILAEFPHVHSVKVRVSKFNPPLGGICRRARITLKRKRACNHKEKYMSIENQSGTAGFSAYENLYENIRSKI